MTSRIAYITVRLPGVSSGEEFLLPEIHELVKRGYDLTLVPREGSPHGPWPRERGGGIAAIVRGLGSREVIWQFVKTLATDPGLIFRVTRDCCLDTTFSNIIKNLRVLPKGVWLGKMVRLQSIDHIHAHWGASTATLADIAHHVSGVPWSLTLHRGDIVQNNRLQQKVISASFTRFISLSGVALFERITGQAPGSIGNVKVIHMGVDVPSIDAPIQSTLSSPFLIVCPANLLPVKGHVFLLEAMQLLQRRGIDVRLFVAGDGVLRPTLEAWVSEHNLRDKVTFIGQQDHTALLDGYRERTFHAVVIPSIDMGNGHHEGIPVSLMEGMAFGLPVISTETGGIPELLHGGAGLLIPAQNSDKLADAIESLASDHNFAAETGRRGRDRVVAEFEIGKVAERITDCIRDSL